MISVPEAELLAEMREMLRAAILRDCELPLRSGVRYTVDWPVQLATLATLPSLAKYQRPRPDWRTADLSQDVVYLEVPLGELFEVFEMLPHQRYFEGAL